MAGHRSEIVDRFFDKSRDESHSGLVCRDSQPTLMNDRNYIIIWAYWNGPDEKIAAEDGDAYAGVNTLYVYRDGIISRGKYFSIVQEMKVRLQAVGVADLNLNGKHLLISVNQE